MKTSAMTVAGVMSGTAIRNRRGRQRHHQLPPCWSFVDQNFAN